MDVDVAKVESWSMAEDLSRFLVPTSVSLGVSVLLLVWGFGDFLVVDELLSFVSGSGRLQTVVLLGASASLLSFAVLVSALVYYSAKVFRYLRYVNPPGLRKIFFAFSTTFAGSTTMLGLIPLYYVLRAAVDSVRRVAHSLFITTTSVSVIVLAVSVILLSACFAMLGLRLREALPRFIRASAVLASSGVVAAAVGLAGLPLLPLGMGVSAYFLSGVGRQERRERRGLRLFVLCTCVSLFTVSSISLVVAYSPLSSSLPLCPTWLPADVVLLPAEQGDTRYAYSMLFLISNPASRVVYLNSSVLYVQVGNRLLVLPLFVYEWQEGWYTARVAYCDNCDPVLGRKASSIYMYRLELRERLFNTTIPTSAWVEVLPYVERKGYLYPCGKIVIRIR